MLCKKLPAVKLKQGLVLAVARIGSGCEFMLARHAASVIQHITLFYHGRLADRRQMVAAAFL